MNQLVSITTALCLPAPDIEALIQGHTVAALSRIFIRPGQQFALSPADSSAIPLSIEQYYRPIFLDIAYGAIRKLNSQELFAQTKQISLLAEKEKLQLPIPTSETVSIQAWARCELCQIIDSTELLIALSSLTIWTKEALQETLKQRQNIFLAYLRIYHLPKAIEILVKRNSQFVALPQPITASDANPVLSDRIFNLRKHQLETRQPPLHPELENLQSAIASLAITNPSATELDRDIKAFLGWSSDQSTNPVDSDLAWIHTIADVGNSSDGHAFEKLVRKGLLQLGFTGSGLDPDSTGGPGGMDFYCEYPYRIVGECKATKSYKVPDGTPAQLLKIGMNHLGKVQYDCSIKLIVAAGDLTFYALRTATENYMNVIRPETLQRLVEMQVHYKGCINLIELKQCLQNDPFGLADDKINNYIEKVCQNIKLRSHIVQVLKNYLEATKYEPAGVEGLHGAYVGSHPPQSLESSEIHEILLELSSPLTGYVGRIKGENWRGDRFYFLRDLPITNRKRTN